MDLHAIKQVLQSHFSDGLVTVVGSGLSCAEGLPTMAELAAYLELNVPSKLLAESLILWDELLPSIKSKGLEAALIAKAPTAELEAAIVAVTVELIQGREREVISDVFSGKRRLRFSRLLTQMLKPSNGLPVITTNYDRLIEVASEDMGLGVDCMFIGHFAGELNERESRLSFCRDVGLKNKQVVWRYREKVNVYKPHGSLDWYHREGKPVRYSGELTLPRLIITPGLNKFRNGYESPFDIHRERANAAIDKAGRFLIIGYGFNDDHLETHLLPGIKSGKPTLIITFALSPNADGLARNYANVIALERVVLDGEVGTRLIINKEEVLIPKMKLWDLHDFITEVLEP